jgi:outer membrane protein assembly factor BamA
MDFVGAVALKSGAVLFEYNALFPSLLNKIDLAVRAQASQLEVRNFYGFGNTSTRDRELENSDFYRVNASQYLIHPSLMLRPRKNLALGIEAVVKHFRLKPRGNRYLNASRIDSIGNDLSSLGIGLGLEVDTRDDRFFPRHGVYWKVDAWNSPGVFNQPNPFLKIIGDFRFFTSDTMWKEIVFALRFKGEKLQGKYPFQEAAFLGGAESLRGYRLQRFGGDASVMGSADLRFSLLHMKIVVPTEVGILLLADAGRVWFDNDSPGDWHTDIGAGLWGAPFTRDLTLSMILVSSVEGLFLNAGFGFSF